MDRRLGKEGERGQRRAIAISRGCNCSCNTDLPVRAELGIIDQMSACNANTLPWQPCAVCSLLLFAHYETYISTNICIRFAYLYAGITRAIAREKRSRVRSRVSMKKIRPLPMKRTMISLGNYSPDPRATFSGNSRV